MLFFLKEFEKEEVKRRKYQEKGSRDLDPNLLNLSNSLIAFFVFQQLKIYCAYLDYKVMMHEEFFKYDKTAFKLIPAVFQLLEEQESWHPMIQIYWQLCTLFEDIEQENSLEYPLREFTKIEDTINDNKEVLVEKELIEIYSHLTNYAAYHINNHRNEFILKCIHYNLEVVDLEKKNDKNFVINVGVYKNLVSLILKLKKEEDAVLSELLVLQKVNNILDWADNFIETNKQYLPKKKSIYYTYNKALLLFHRGRLIGAYLLIKDLSRVREMFVSLDLKVLRLQVILELEIQDISIPNQENLQIIEETEQYRMLLRNDKDKKPKLTDYHKDYYWNFLHLYRRFYVFFNQHGWMYRFGDEAYFEKRNNLKNELRITPHSYGKWFLEKLDEIK